MKCYRFGCMYLDSFLVFIRTSKPDGLLMLLQVRKVGWATLRLVNGTLEYSLGDTRMSLVTPR